MTFAQPCLTALMTPTATVLPHVPHGKTAWRWGRKSEISEKRHRRRGSMASARGAFPPRTQQPSAPAHLEAGTRRRSPHTWPCRGPSARWQRHPTSRALGLSSSFLPRRRSIFSSVQQTCRRCGLCDSPALENSQLGSVLGDSGRSPGGERGGGDHCWDP